MKFLGIQRVEVLWMSDPAKHLPQILARGTSPRRIRHGIFYFARVSPPSSISKQVHHYSCVRKQRNNSVFSIILAVITKIKMADGRDRESGLVAIRYRRGKLEVLNQKLLPHQFVYEDVKTCEEAFYCIKDMRTRGMSSLPLSTENWC